MKRIMLLCSYLFPGTKGLYNRLGCSKLYDNHHGHSKHRVWNWWPRHSGQHGPWGCCLQECPSTLSPNTWSLQTYGRKTINISEAHFTQTFSKWNLVLLIKSKTNRDLGRQECLCTSTPSRVWPLWHRPLPKEPILQKHTSCTSRKRNHGEMLLPSTACFNEEFKRD